ncbi:MAG: hypothetical protein KJ043_19525 [Anaerolineae bacterium]|nr:hypothetical protein [Anaerolineae bacterium]
MKRYSLWIGLLLIIGMVACTPTEDENSPLPTQPFEQVEQPDVNPNADTTQAVDVSPQDSTPITPVVLVSPTTSGPRPLPPTWTPIPPTATPTLEPTLDVGGTWLAATVPPEATLNPGCTTFNLDPLRTQNTVVLGQAPILAWTPATGAVLYRVYVYDETGGIELHEELVQETTVTINPDVFRRDGVYVWTVAPLDPFGIQMCIELGDAIIVERG